MIRCGYCDFATPSEREAFSHVQECPANPMVRKCHEFEADVDRLQAIVDKVDKTIDGVVIRNGMKVYPSSAGYIWPATVRVQATNRTTPPLGLAGPLPRDDIDPTQCYSTLEAAEAAGKEGD